MDKIEISVTLLLNLVICRNKSKYIEKIKGILCEAGYLTADGQTTKKAWDMENDPEAQ